MTDQATALIGGGGVLGGSGALGTSAANVLQTGAAQMEGSLKKFGNSWKMVFFGCACATLLSSTIVFLSIFNCTPFDLVCLIYQTFFGLLLFIMDSPVHVASCDGIKEVVYKYCLFLTRFTGRGIAYVFLGCMVCSLLWDNDISPFLGFVLGGLICAAGVVAGWHGYLQSKKLEIVRKALLTRGGPTQSVCGPSGLPLPKFREMASRITPVQFTDEELGYIANAMSVHVRSDDIISQREFELWMKDPNWLLL